WATLRRAPLVAGLAITLADPGGPIEATKETMASLRAVASPGSDEELLVALSQDAMALTQQRQNPLKDFKPRGATAGQEVLDELRAANEIVSAKATPEEAAGFRVWLIAAAKASADAAKEGGFMGFGAEQVSQGERTMLEQLGKVLGVEPA
ncbi:MAG: hypothetical protein ACRDHU_11575, partial [Actinomycetota bacterium]